jgi:hypothetical protein
MGPGIAEQNPITYRMAQALEDDFFNEIDAMSHGDLQKGAKLRFTHAEIICPFASLLGLKGHLHTGAQSQHVQLRHEPLARRTYRAPGRQSSMGRRS